MTKRAISLACFLTSILAVAMMISAHRSSRTSAAPPHALPVSVVPTGTMVHVRLLQSISEDSKAGDMLQGVVADPVLVNSRVIIPVNTRAVTKVVGIQRQKDGMANVS